MNKKAATRAELDDVVGSPNTPFTSAETQLTGEAPERIWINPISFLSALHMSQARIHFEKQFQNDVEYSRTDLAINESPKTEVTVFTITDKGNGISRDYSITPTGLENGGEVVRKSDYDAAIESYELASQELNGKLRSLLSEDHRKQGWIDAFQSDLKDVQTVNESLVAELTKARDTLHDLILPLRMWQRGLAADGCQIAVNSLNETLAAATENKPAQEHQCVKWSAFGFCLSCGLLPCDGNPAPDSHPPEIEVVNGMYRVKARRSKGTK